MTAEKLGKRVIVCIPSLSRPTEICKKTLAFVKDCGLPYKVFVEPQEYFLYKYNCGKGNVVKLPDSGRGIGYSRNRMRDYARENGFEFIFELDDDVSEFARIDTADKKDAFLLTVEDCINAMDEYEKLVGIRFTQYRYWIYSKKKMHKWTHLNKPLQGVAFMRLSTLPAMSDNYSHFEDTAVSLLSWEQGLFTLNYGLSGLNVSQNQGKGGCNIGDRGQSAKYSIAEIKKALPYVYETTGSSYFGVEMNIDYYNEKYHAMPVNCEDDQLHEILKRLGYE